VQKEPKTEIQMSAGCTGLQQRKNNEPATSQLQPTAEAELKQGAEGTKNRNPNVSWLHRATTTQEQ
jgi:hypothetical protein